MEKYSKANTQSVVDELDALYEMEGIEQKPARNWSGVKFILGRLAIDTLKVMAGASIAISERNAAKRRSLTREENEYASR